MSTSSHADVIVVGAGPAGLAAATALSSAGAKVIVLERKPFVGGRAYSYLHPALQEVVDCQHVLLGCCTNLRYLLEDAGAGDFVQWYDELVFLEPNGRSSPIRPTSLPAPLHSSLDFLSAGMLSLVDKIGIARGLMHFMRGYPASDEESFANWLKRTGQSKRAVRHFWEPVIVGALNDGFENCSLRYAGQVFREAFLKSPEGGRLGIPTVPLSQLFGEVGRRAESQGAIFQLSCSVDTPLQQVDGQWTVHVEAGTYHAPNVVLAVPFEQVARLLPPDGGVSPELSAFRHAPITTLHLWFDREISPLPHAVLLDTGIQWLFNKSVIRKSAKPYLELVISASHGELRESREELITNALRELEMFFPAVKQAKLLKSGILKEARATFSVLPGLDQYRPDAVTPFEGLFLAGDWVKTGWPSTMEGGVRSGYLAAEAVAKAPGRFLQPDLPATGLMKLFG